MWPFADNWSAWFSPATNRLLVTGVVNAPVGYTAFLERKPKLAVQVVYLKVVFVQGVIPVANPQRIFYQEILPEGYKPSAVRILYGAHKDGLLLEICLINE